MSYGTVTSLSLNAIFFVAFNLFYGLTKAHIDMAAHVGGLLAGIPIGAALAFGLATGSAKARLLRSVVVGAVSLAVMAPIARRVPVLDDWPSEFKQWIAVTRDTSTRLNQLREERRAKRLTPAQVADTIERELQLPLKAERARVEALRLPPDQKAVARKTVEYMALEVEALQLITAGERSGDEAVIDQGVVKGDEAAEALLRVIPDPALAALLKERKAARASIAALTAEIARIGDLEKEQARLYNQAVRDFRSQKAGPDAFALVIEQQMLPPWAAEREQLANLQVVTEQEPQAKRLLEYMSLRAEGWRLMAAGLRANDKSLVERGNAKQLAAKKLIEGSARGRP
jgi:hypothetical protein